MFIFYTNSFSKKDFFRINPNRVLNVNHPRNGSKYVSKGPLKLDIQSGFFYLSHMHYLYIMFSASLNKYYIGHTSNLGERLQNAMLISWITNLACCFQW
ncbi:GIY-YIG nuclease family protein [Pedobacter sp.]|uniref:GIY-YIG nuclease family protein n=1 Tax=Pedobacter sp. TaxID=1411316 RepID=UPI003D0BF409